jgi:hypothetical protein
MHRQLSRLQEAGENLPKSASHKPALVNLLALTTKAVQEDQKACHDNSNPAIILNTWCKVRGDENDLVPDLWVVHAGPRIRDIRKVNVEVEVVKSNGEIDHEDAARQEEQFHETSRTEARTGA